MDDGFSGTRDQWFAALRGADGAPGKDGREGRDGKDGAPGRDAAELEPLSSLDHEKSYPRGTWMTHAGGLLRAARTTDPVLSGNLEEAGWQIVCDGVFSVSFNPLGDGRSFEIRLGRTSGAVVTIPFRVPTMLDRGVWRSGTYEEGDSVTYGGSVFICQRETTDQPGTSDAWRLAVKRGQNGKDGKQGPEGPKGPKGDKGQ